MAKLTKEQLRFLARHSIEVSEAFDASGLSRSQYGPRMRDEGKFVAYGVVRCQKGSHSLRSRSGNCIQCFPASIGFSRRATLSGYVYIAQSNMGKLIKIGFSGDPDDRIYIANLEGYGGAYDWQIRRMVWSDRAGELERALHRDLESYRIDKEWVRNGYTVWTRELFNCALGTASKALGRNLSAGEF